LLLFSLWLALSGFDIPPVPVSLNIAGQPISLGLSGSVSESMELYLRVDLSDFQTHLTPLLQAELNKSDRCGERISIENATLQPQAPAAANLTVRLHFEKWACFKAFGKENAKRLVGGDAVVEMKMTPETAEVGRIEADGSLGELLRSGSLGDALRDKIRESLLKSVHKVTDLDAMIPPQVRPYVEIRSLAFGGDSALELMLTAQLKLPADQASRLLDQLRNRK
jgi:hypothetical protein